jgi:hypothetical protein
MRNLLDPFEPDPVLAFALVPDPDPGLGQLAEAAGSDRPVQYPLTPDSR